MSRPGKIHIFEERAGKLSALLFGFDVNSSILKPEHLAWIAVKLIPFATKNGFTISTIGLASRTGSDDLNMKLSGARSLAVFQAAYLHGHRKLRDITDLALGERLAALAGFGDNTEDERWRAVFVTVQAEGDPVYLPTPPNLVPRLLLVTVLVKEEHKTFTGGEPGEKAYQAAQALRSAQGWAYNVISEKKGMVDSRFDLLRITCKRHSSSHGIPLVSTYEIDYVDIEYTWGPGKMGNDYWPKVKLIKRGTPGHARDKDVVYEIGVLTGQEWVDHPTKAYARS